MSAHRIELAEILAHCAAGLVAQVFLTGSPDDGFAAELPVVALFLFDGKRVTHVENFEFDQRDQALTRFREITG
ncbi:hypothetical protein [Mycolicibacterium sp. XJ1819]